jgi:hypothetical protein
VFGIIPLTWSIKVDPLNLEKILPLPKNNYLRTFKNTVFIKPFGLSPPPSIQGAMESFAIETRTIFLTFLDKEAETQSLTTNSLKSVEAACILAGSPWHLSTLQFMIRNPKIHFDLAWILYPSLSH